MPTRHTISHSRLIAAAIFGALLGMHPATAQLPEVLDLDAVIERLEANLHHYDATVPSFLCDEHVISQVVPGPINSSTTTDSVFRLKRDVHPDHTENLIESRDVKTVNGHPANADDISGPSLLSGAFSGGLAIVSVSQEECMTYKLRPIKPNHPKTPYIVDFTSIDNPRHPERCLLREEGSGHITIDPRNMQITRMDLTAPHHIITPSHDAADGTYTSPVTGPWVISVEYSPVLLSGQTFWMPRTIQSTMTSGTPATGDLTSAGAGGGRGGSRPTGTFGSSRPAVWSFEAHYRNYHKLEVTSRIVP